MENAPEYVCDNFMNPTQNQKHQYYYISDNPALSFISSSEKTKRKWSDVSEEIDDLDTSLCLQVPCVKKNYLGTEKLNLNLELGLSIGNAEIEKDVNYDFVRDNCNSSVPNLELLIVDTSRLEQRPPLTYLQKPPDILPPNAGFDPFLPPNLVDPSEAPPYYSFLMPKKGSAARALKALAQMAPQNNYGNASKNCQAEGCRKRARGSTGLCILHGGGKRCQKNGCRRGSNDGSVFCKAHGGGRRCQHLGCIKSAEGKTDFCIAHGGGKRCSFEGCTHSAKGRYTLCIKHGGGRRCQMRYCTKSAEGSTNYCIKHGGGRRCQHPACTKGAQGGTLFCKAHGGGKRCVHPGCSKAAQGSTRLCKAHGGGKKCMFEGGGVCLKIVYGAATLCNKHGGGRRCTFPNCTKGARGSTKLCIRHGGGKRCIYEGCGKSIKTSHDFCKIHGGWKKCCWGDLGQIFDAEKNTISPCNTVAIKETSLCVEHTQKVEEMGSSNPFPTMQFQAVSSVYKVVNFGKSCGFSNGGYLESDDPNGFERGNPPVQFMFPELRVHGGERLGQLLEGGDADAVSCGSGTKN